MDSIQKRSKKLKEIVSEVFSIFREKHETVLFKIKRLKVAIYYLVSGHGGLDPGAMASYGCKHISEYTYDITQRLAKELLSHGASLYILIRDENDGIGDGCIL